MSPHILFDLSRLLSRVARTVPSGIDRVELAYARHLIETARDRLSFAAMTNWGRFGPLSAEGGIRLVEALGSHWRHSSNDHERTSALVVARRLRFQLLLQGEASLHARVCRFRDRLVYLLVSHHHLDRPAPLRRLKERTGAQFVFFVHDLIPIEFPEYARPGQAERHGRRMDTVTRLADAVIVNSASTRATLQRHFGRANRNPPMLVAPLGLDLRPVAARARPASQPPYFICVGTIEPKKNHLLLLNVWRQLAAAFGQDIPRLILVGQRGWENENVIDMIERSVRIRGLVEEHNSLPDSTMESLIVGARALLAPSFAEGYGLPVAEALSLGVPVLCSDLPALRAVGKEVPEYFDPLDGPAWRDAILDYARPDSARRHAQLMRLSAWRPHSWDEHFAAVTRLIDDLPPNPAREGRPLAHEPNGARGHH